MSHYTVLVINTKGNNDVDAQLAPFDENIEMPEYERGEVSEDDIKAFVSYYVEKDSSLKGLSVEELYELKGDSWNSGRWEFNDDGTVVEMSTYNPNSKWDWYQIGGRWAGSLILKPEAEKKSEPNFSWGWSEEQKLKVLSQPRVDQAKKKDVEFIDPEEFDRAMRFWELYIEGQEPKNEEEKNMIAHIWYKPEYYTDTYKDKLTYAKCRAMFSTFAVLKDGKWMEKGEMGWFGCSSETPDEALEWELNFFDHFIKDLPDNALLTVVDCHI